MANARLFLRQRTLPWKFRSTPAPAFLYTDGIVESMNAAREEFGKSRLKKFLASSSSSASQLADALLLELRRWSTGERERAQDDDITLLVLDFIQHHESNPSIASRIRDNQCQVHLWRGGAAMTATSNVLPATAATSHLSPELTRLAVLLALSIFINYIDRGNLALAAPLIKDELGLSFYQIGLLLFPSSGLTPFSKSFRMAGRPLSRQLGARTGILLCQPPHLEPALVRSFTTLLAMRLILGIGESVAYPSYSKIISRHFPSSSVAAPTRLFPPAKPPDPLSAHCSAACSYPTSGETLFIIFGWLAHSGCCRGSGSCEDLRKLLSRCWHPL